MTRSEVPRSSAPLATTPAAAPGHRAVALRIDVFTIFAEVVDAYCTTSVVGRARRDGLVDLRIHDLRSAATDPHRTVDDAPFGGGAGMVLAPEPVFGAVELADPPRPLYLLAPGGRRFDQSVAAELAGLGCVTPRPGPAAFSLLCGRYEGVDQRIADHLVDGELSVGDFVLAGGSWRPWSSSRPRLGSFRGCLGTQPRPATKASLPGCWSTRSTRARRCSGAGRFLRSCVGAITAGSDDGAVLRHSGARSSVGRTCWTPEGVFQPTRCASSSSTAIL